MFHTHRMAHYEVSWDHRNPKQQDQQALQACLAGLHNIFKFYICKLIITAHVSKKINTNTNLIL